MKEPGVYKNFSQNFEILLETFKIIFQILMWEIFTVYIQKLREDISQKYVK